MPVLARVLWVQRCDQRPNGIPPIAQIHCNGRPICVSFGAADCNSLHTKINVDLDRGMTVMHIAAANGHPLCLRQLLERGLHGADIASMAQRGTLSTPAHLAAASGHLSCLEVLMGAGININVKDAEGRSPLECALEGSHSGCVVALKRHFHLGV